MFRNLITLLTLLASSSSFAVDTSPSCKSSRNTRDLYDCILLNHPDFKAAKLSHEIATATRDKTTQWPNPEVSVRSVKGENAGENVGGTEVGVSINVTELLVKRPALSNLGRSEERYLKVAAEEEEFKVKSQVVKDLYRYRQLVDELELTVEALATFAKIENQFRARRARGPEQEITLNLVELVQGDYQLRRNHLVVEKSEIETKFKGIFGAGFELKKELLPALKMQWPAVQIAGVSKNTFELRKAEADRQRSQAEKSIANAESWPRIDAGPVFERATEGPVQYTSSGFNVNVSIPILSLNGGARAVAEKNKLRAELVHDYALKKSDLEKQLILQKYQTAVESLKQSAGGDNLRKKHSKIDSFFRQGLTSGTTVIEAHRQILEFTESQHEHELTALDSLMYLNLLSGKNVEEVLR